jgi:hypothetical protein
MTAKDRRHVLVIATQCEAMPDLEDLDTAARSLVAVLTDPGIGACSPGLPDGQSLLVGRLGADEIWAAARTAVSHAAHAGATLVMAFLGHGMVTGEHPTLYLLGWKSVDGRASSAVNVKDLLGQAVDHLGVRGVVGIVDTCNAAAAPPAVEALTTGARGGRTSLHLLMASPVQQNAYDLDLSKALTRLLTTGVATGETHLGLNTLTRHLRAADATRRVVTFSYDGDSKSDGLWLAQNRQEAHGSTAAVGPRGIGDLTAGLLALFPDRPLPVEWTTSGLRDLQREVAALPVTHRRIRVERALDSLIVAERTVALLRSFMPKQLSTPALRRALKVIGTHWRGPLTDERDAVEFVALNHPRSEGSCRPAMARFVVALAHDAAYDLDAVEIRAWASEVGALLPYNDVVLATRETSRQRRLRLVVRLDSPAGDWPETLSAWLLLDGDVHLRAVFTECSPSQTGAEAKLVEAVEWAEAEAVDLGLELRHIDIALPSTIMLRWAPEEVLNGTRLGEQYEVRPRWSIRLDPPAGMRWINKHARARLSAIAARDTDCATTWLLEDRTRQMDRLMDDLRNGRLTTPIGLMKRPREDPELMDLLLAFTPILMWPAGPDGRAEHCAQVEARWDGLPTAFLAAYRARWKGDRSDPLADLRSIWDDDEWLRFCIGRGVRSHNSPGSTK